MAQQMQQLQMQLLQAQIVNEQAKGQENAVDVQLKTAKTQTEQAKARNMHSDSDKKDLDFLEQESGVANARDQQAAERRHEQSMESKEFDRLAKLDEKAFDSLRQAN